ncbi:MAG: hypothetical protein ABIJ21_00070 [Nanoarchaeota archaeon]
MPTAYALIYVSPGNSFKRSYGVFYYDPGKSDNVLHLSLGNTPSDASHLGRLIARYFTENNGKEKMPISFRKPKSFPDIGMLEFPEILTIISSFEELDPGELQKAQKSMMKTLKGQ